MTIHTSSRPSDLECPLGLSFDRRWKAIEDVVIPLVAGIANATEIDFRAFSGGHIKFDGDASASLTTVAFHHAHESGGTYEPIYDVDGNVVTVTTAKDHSTPFPDECFSCHFLKLTGNVAVTAASGSATVTLKV